MSNKIKWTDNECEILYDNFNYYLKHKKEAVRDLNRSWNSIVIKANRIGCKCDNFNKSNNKILNVCRDYFDGLLLSDGSYISQALKTGYYSQVCMCKEWLNIIKDYFMYNNIKCTLNSGRLDYGFGGCSLLYQLISLPYIEFKIERCRWYPDGVKIVPKDIILTPECVINWYLGDGDNQVKLATMGFDIDSLMFLSDLLNSTIDIQSYVDKYKRINILKLRDKRIFFNYIRDCNIPSCYAYKFPEEYMYM